MSRELKSVLIVVVVVAALVALFRLVLWPLWWTPPKGGGVVDANAAAPAARAVADDANRTAGADANAHRPPTGTGAAATQTAAQYVPALPKLDAAAAAAAFRKGTELLAAKRYGEAREELSAALLSNKLPGAQEAVARKTLSDLADQMIFSPRVFDADPYAFQYTFQTGDVLNRVERKLALHVPAELILRINGIADARAIRAGQTLKMLRGPFHAVVTKSKFVLDLYLYGEGRRPVFVRQFRIGLGKNGSTPVGMWRVAVGKKYTRATWYPPPNSPQHRSIAWGQSGYPLGKDGYWIGLEGADEHTRLHTGYGIHGTNEPQTIGTEASLGCIRLADPDIAMVFSTLYEKWSTVEIRP